MIGALDRPTEGRVLIDGIDINKLSDDGLAELRNKKIGFIFQTYNLLARISVLRNVELPLIVRGTPAQVRRKKALSALEEVGLRDKAFNKPTQLSGGEQQRVAIARALVSDPKILLADEPTGNLDSANAKLIAELFSELNQKGRTIVMVTHNMEMASYARRIIYLRDGMIEREVVNA
jgi:putative ABC transport system ATP-binding protein